jgi:hypothetical protein
MLSNGVIDPQLFLQKGWTMKHKIILAAAMFAIGVPFAHAETLDIKPRTRLVTADGVKLGVDRAVKAKDGSVLGAQVIFDGQFITIPSDTLSASENGLVTTLTRKDLRGLRK